MAAATDRGAELKRHLDEAFRAFEAGQDERARRLCRQALAIDPDNTTAHSLMGLLYEREGRAVEAASEFEHVVEVNPESQADRQTLRRLRGEEVREAEPVVFYEEEDDEEARRRIYTYAGIGALAVALIVMFGFIVYGHAGRGAGQTNQAVLKDLEIAQQAYERGRYEDAMEAAQRVLARQPDNALAKQIYERAKAQLGGGRVAGAGRGADAGNPPAVQSAPALPPGSVAPGAAPVGQPGANVVTAPAPGAGTVPVPQPNPAYRGGIPSPAVTTVPPAPVGGNMAAATTGGDRYRQFGTSGAAMRIYDRSGHPAMYPTRPMVGDWAPARPQDSQPGTAVTTRPAPPANERISSGNQNLGGGNIKIEVNRGGGAGSPATTGAEVRPQGSADAPPPAAGMSVDPAVAAEAERQRKLRQMRERGQ